MADLKSKSLSGSQDLENAPAKDRAGSRKILAFPAAPAGGAVPRPAGTGRRDYGPTFLRVDTYQVPRK